MARIQVKQLDYALTPVAGLSLVGHYLRAVLPQFDAIDTALPVRSGVRNSDVLRAYLGLLVQGKSDFDAIEAFRGDAFFKQALGLELLPSSPTLRQRFDAQAAYLGRHGYCLELALRPGVQHSASETQFNLERIVPMAQRLSQAGPQAPILARLDSGFDSAALQRALAACNQPGLPQVDWLIKWNPRGQARADALSALAERLASDATQPCQQPRPGKRVWLWEEAVQIEGIAQPLRRVLRLIERTIDRHGQQLLVPDLELEGWTTSLPAKTFAPEQVIQLYADHGTHEQFHAEFKTDLDLERLPSGKFDTNHLVCQLATVAMNILRLMGQGGLLGPDAPIRHPAKRRRIKTVMQELVYKAGRLIEHGRQLILGLGVNDRAAAVFMRLHGQLQAAPS